ncbi:hypothetical protein BLOT_005130 [Blomia tropicalis]|nr:hypothetical protein BLOT_005130 [Blomia tropicalis]
MAMAMAILFQYFSCNDNDGRAYTILGKHSCHQITSVYYSSYPRAHAMFQSKKKTNVQTFCYP